MCACFVKRKRGYAFMLTNSLFVHKKLLADFSFDEVGAKEKSIKKKSAANGGASPLHPASFWKSLTKTFSLFCFTSNKIRAPCARFSINPCCFPLHVLPNAESFRAANKALQCENPHPSRGVVPKTFLRCGTRKRICRAVRVPRCNCSTRGR